MSSIWQLYIQSAKFVIHVFSLLFMSLVCQSCFLLRSMETYAARWKRAMHDDVSCRILRFAACFNLQIDREMTPDHVIWCILRYAESSHLQIDREMTLDRVICCVIRFAAFFDLQIDHEMTPSSVICRILRYAASHDMPHHQSESSFLNCSTWFHLSNW